LDFVHLRTHARAWTRAVGEHEIRDPDVAGEGFAFEAGSSLIGQCEIGNSAQRRQVGMRGAAN
jgi:hypothetical protein